MTSHSIVGFRGAALLLCAAFSWAAFVEAASPLPRKHLNERQRKQLSADTNKDHESVAAKKPPQAPAAKVKIVDSAVKIVTALKDPKSDVAKTTMAKDTTADLANMSAPDQVIVPITGRMVTKALSALVYFCGSILVAYLYYQARTKYEKVFLPQSEKTVFPMVNEFSFGLCSCLTDPKICAMGFCCPCLRWADTLDRQGVLRYWPAFLAMFSLGLLSFYTQGLAFIATVVLGVFYRQKLRERFQIEGGNTSVIKDMLVWCFCQPCAIVQEAREEAVQRGMAGV